ncbi:MAG TPA: ABC transporter permease [Vicinamibacterales bacterium]|nr:ABC transporter permease [Vicinamibacterales bacterium]
MARDTSGVVDSVGAGVGRALAWIGDVSCFGARALRDMFRRPFELDEIVRQVHEIGWRSVPLVAAAGLAVGIVLSMHTRDSLERFGAEAKIPAGLALALVRETGPLLTGLLVAGRVGAGIGAELGAMNATEQIDALEATAIDAFKYLAVTRIAACVIALPVLTIIVDFSGIFGGFLAEHAVSGIDFRLYFTRSFELMSFDDLLPATLKTAVFGLIIGTIASYLGFTTREGTEGVGRASTRSVVLASLSIILINVVLVKLIFVIFPSQ